MNEKDFMKKYPGEMIDPCMLDEEAKRSQCLNPFQTPIDNPRTLMFGSEIAETCSPSIGCGGKTNMALNIMTEVLSDKGNDVEHLQEAMDIYKEVRGPSDFSLEQELKQAETESKPKRIAIIGGPRAIANKILAQAEELGIEPTALMYDESELLGSGDIKSIPPSLLSSKDHLLTSPFAHGGKPRIESELETNRKQARNLQKYLNEKQGYGKRITKKTSKRTKSDITTYVSKFSHEIEIKK